MLGLPVLYYILEFVQTHVHWVSDAIQPSHHLSSPSPPALKLSSIRVFSNELALCIRWLKYWSFSFSISPSNEYSGLISLKIGLFEPCCPRAFQASSPAPQFEGINSLASVHGISQPRILEWVAIYLSRGSSQPRDWSSVSCIGRWIVYGLVTWKALTSS